MKQSISEHVADQRTVEEQRAFEAESIAAHYNLSAQAFSLVLGGTMGYAAGIFEGPEEDLETGQNRKLDMAAHALGLRPGFKLLDVGCGWGNFSLPFAQTYAAHVHGITLSHVQADHIAHRAAELGIADHIRISIGHIENLPWGEDEYDGIICSGSLIHMHHRREVHQLIGRILRPGGAIFISDSYIRGKAHGDNNSRGAEFIRSMFGSARLLTLSAELSMIEEAGLIVRDVQEHTNSYVTTLDHWIRNIRANRNQIEQLTPGMAKDFQSYMTLAKRAFSQRTMLEYTIVAAKPSQTGQLANETIELETP